MPKRKPDSQTHRPEAEVLEERAPKRDPWGHFGKVLGVDIYMETGGSLDEATYADSSWFDGVVERFSPFRCLDSAIMPQSSQHPLALRKNIGGIQVRK